MNHQYMLKFEARFSLQFPNIPHLHFLTNIENKSLLIFKSLKQDIDLNVKLEKNHEFQEFSRIHKNFFFFTIYWAGFQLTTLVVIDTDGIGSYKSNYRMITTAACKILTIKDLQQTSLWSRRLSIAISSFQELPLLAVIKSYKEKKRKSQFHNMLFQLLPPHLCLVDSYTMRVQCLQIW